MRNMVSTLAVAVVASGVTVWILSESGSPVALAQVLPPPLLPDPPGETVPVGPPGDLFTQSGLTPDEAVNVAVYDRVNRSVVNISTVSIGSRRFFMLAVPEPGSGSGSVIDKEGHILTNYHVVEGARQVSVTLYDEETYEAELVGADPVNDIAILKIDAPGERLFPVTFGESANLRVGMRVFALGNPFGLNRTMSMGIISSLNRSLEVRENWVIKSIIQIDASINPGNSGGPLLDAHGRLIGMNTAIATADARQSAGIGFAIPVDLVRRVVPELIEYGRVIRGDIGITHVSVTEKGLRIARLVPGGPAERAGLRGPTVTRRGPVVIEDRSAADVVIAVDGEKVTTAAEFLGHIESKKPGDVVTLTVQRGERTVDVEVILSGEEEVAPVRPRR
ncbi:MAG: PDZ domain-containing protein [Planctomycetota bacterium]|nr:MAG: PDZ domain-containing protein [Planctomycetota bacterium]REK21669.1 MAG: PDZ domain-containing protein [Planctomycetota bacterium]REK32771.1 MAG: PDZ domain-containing protein [Planctomycetota bacterium]